MLAVTLAELQCEMVHLRFVNQQIKQIEDAAKRSGALRPRMPRRTKAAFIRLMLPNFRRRSLTE